MTEKIRKATKKDISKIQKMLNSEPELIDDDSLNYRKCDVMQYITPPMRTFVYEIDKKIVAIITGAFWKVHKTINLYHLVVDKKHRRKGIGLKLRKYLEEYAKKHKYELIWSYVEEKNKKMQKLLRKLNYKKGKKMYFFHKELK
jgi:ribosomal protein S18 acetylase RimI-like enzyme